MMQESLTEDHGSVQQEPATRSARWRRFIPIGIILMGLVIGYAMGWHHYLSLEFLTEQRDALLNYVAENYLLSLLLFFTIYTLAVAFSFPAASILTVFGGFLFGWLVGGVTVAFAATLGATILFLAARSAFGDFLRSKVGGPARRLADGFRDDAFNYLLVLRLAPFFPFFVINIAPALFGVNLRTYVTATFIGILPGCFAYAWLGQGIGSVLESAERAGNEISLKDLVTSEISFAFIALAVVALIPVVVRKIRAKTASEGIET